MSIDFYGKNGCACRLGVIVPKPLVSLERSMRTSPCCAAASETHRTVAFHEMMRTATRCGAGGIAADMTRARQCGEINLASYAIFLLQRS